MASSNGPGFGGAAVKDYFIPILTALSTAILGYLTFYIETDLKGMATSSCMTLMKKRKLNCFGSTQMRH